MDGSVWLGPNAVLAFKREGYSLLDFNLKDATEELSFGYLLFLWIFEKEWIWKLIFSSGLRKLALKNLKYGINEMYRGFSIPATVAELQKFVPSLRVSDVVR